MVALNSHSRKLESARVLASGIAHDINNLLGSIHLHAEQALSDLASGSAPVDEINSIKTVALRAAEIVRQLMIDSRQEKPDYQPVDLPSLVREMLALLKVYIPKHATLKTDLGADLPPVLGNAPQLRQVLMNLIINASEALRDEGFITVSTSRVVGNHPVAPGQTSKLPDGDYLKLEVSDTGRGMTEEEQARIFDPLFTTKSAGCGLGLAVVQGIIGAHGGAINLVSAPGRGTTFQVFLPCPSDLFRPQSPTVASPGDSPSLAVSKTVLLVEDEGALREPVAKVLRKNGFEVIEAEDGSTAIEIFRARSASTDVVLLDVTIPGASGIEVLEQFHRIGPEIPVVLTSAYSLEMLPLPRDLALVTRFIRKPFQLAELLRLLREVLA